MYETLRRQWGTILKKIDQGTRHRMHWTCSTSTCPGVTPCGLCALNFEGTWAWPLQLSSVLRIVLSISIFLCPSTTFNTPATTNATFTAAITHAHIVLFLFVIARHIGAVWPALACVCKRHTCLRACTPAYIDGQHSTLRRVPLKSRCSSGLLAEMYLLNRGTSLPLFKLSPPHQPALLSSKSALPFMEIFDP